MLRLIDKLYSKVPIGFRHWVKRSAPSLTPLVVRFRSSVWQHKMRRYARMPRDEVFLEIFRDGGWGGDSLSGPGSSAVETRAIREGLPVLLKRFNVRTLLDAPCGDFSWLSLLQLGLDEYLGVDIVPQLIAENKRQYGSSNCRFMEGDIVEQTLPTFDLILCRDCLVHLSFVECLEVVQKFLDTGSKYLLATTFPNVVQNCDITTGSWRPLNLQLAPFCFPEPIELINEQYSGGFEGQFSDKSLGLWDLQNLQSLRDTGLWLS
jgi:SAM-dependent methyltransferase